MQESIVQLREFFKSEVWKNACKEKQPIVSDNGIIYAEEEVGGKVLKVGLDTKINLALDFEGYFNEMAHQYMKWRKEQGLRYDD